MKLKIKPFDNNIKKYYLNHGHFHKGDAGIDLFIPSKIIFDPKQTLPIHLKISCELENKPYFLLPRSSISKTPLRLSNSIGLIDAGYRGEIIASCDNISEEKFELEKGRRLFQIMSITGDPLELEIVDKLSDSSRGDGGFGSTGK